jgi:hypothetical protein
MALKPIKEVGINVGDMFDGISGVMPKVEHARVK